MQERRKFLAGGLGAFLTTLPGKASSQPIAKHGFNDVSIEWQLFDHGQRLALSEGKPILFLAHTTWCPHCMRYREVFFNDEVVKLVNAFIPVIVDRDLQSDITARFAPDGDYIPRTMFLTPEAQLVRELRYRNTEFNYFVDYDDPSNLIKYLRRAIRYFAL